MGAPHTWGQCLAEKVQGPLPGQAAEPPAAFSTAWVDILSTLAFWMLPMEPSSKYPEKSRGGGQISGKGGGRKSRE